MPRQIWAPNVTSPVVAPAERRASSGSGARHAPRTRTRSQAYRAAVSGLDASGAHVHVDLAETRRVVGEQFPDGRLPQGVVSRCFLGPPYEVHILDLGGWIVEHFEVGRAMPPPFESARRLALHPAYEFVEVTEQRLVAVRTDGTAVEIGG